MRVSRNALRCAASGIGIGRSPRLPYCRTRHRKLIVTVESLRKERKTAVDRLAKQDGASDIRVFRSVARRENSEESGVDFLVEFDQDHTLFDLTGLRLALRDLVGVESISSCGILSGILANQCCQPPLLCKSWPRAPT